MFDSTDVSYLRRVWYELYCASKGYELKLLSSESTIGSYYVAYTHAEQRYVTPCSGAFQQRQFARQLESDPEVSQIKLAMIVQINAKDMIAAIRQRN